MDQERAADRGGPRPARAGEWDGVAGARLSDLGDLLRLGALACGTASIALSRRRADNSWATLSHGLTSAAVGDLGRLCDAAAGASEPREIPDLARAYGPGPLVGPPLALRWAYAVPLGNGDPAARPVAAVLVVLDRSARQLSGVDKAGLRALCRQLLRLLTTADRLGAGGPEPTDPRSRRPLAAPSATRKPVRNGPSRVPVDGPPGDLWRNRDVAALFNVTERTVSNWVATGRLPSLRTMGGHLRFRREEILEAYAEHVGEVPADPGSGVAGRP